MTRRARAISAVALTAASAAFVTARGSHAAAVAESQDHIALHDAATSGAHRSRTQHQSRLSWARLRNFLANPERMLRVLLER